MTRLVLILLLIAGFLAGLAAFAPLGTVLNMTGAEARGINWTNASGTILNGRLTGIAAQGKSYGDAGLRLVPGALLSGRLKYAVNWSGDNGKGIGDISFDSGRQVALENFDIDLDLLKLEHAARWIQQSGGRVQLTGTIIRFDETGCKAASGTARSDVLGRNREILGAGWSDMTGELHCDGNDLVIPLESANGAGTKFAARLRVAPGQPGRFDARVSGLIPRELEFALPIAGFKRDGREFIYSFSPTPRSNPI